MSYNLLRSEIKKYIFDCGWEALRPIQIASIEKIMTTDFNYIIVSKTASGKTEAAFLPLLSMIDLEADGVQILYISPLKALINDQFIRITQLCEYLDIPVTSWHGEANQTLKKKLLLQPKGIVLITPESVESLFVNHTDYLHSMFFNLKYIIIDEIHNFAGSDRGLQLQSLLWRLNVISKNSIRIIALSATIKDFDNVKRYTNSQMNTKIILDRTTKEHDISFKFYQSEDSSIPIDLIKDLYFNTKDARALIFPNSRGRAEEISVTLKRFSKQNNGHNNYFSHHSAVDKEIREYIEYYIKSNSNQNYAISCTSTLELGIDIGTVDTIVQIDATLTVSSLIQRLGRSGRRADQVSKLLLYATDEWKLLQAMASWILYTEGFIEDIHIIDKPYDILVHQLLSEVKSRNSIKKCDCVNLFHLSPVFSEIPKNEIIELINHLVKNDIIEEIEDELIIGISGERIVNNFEFYSVFIPEKNYKVYNSGKKIGEIAALPNISIGECIYLSAKIWEIIDINLANMRIETIPAKAGKRPLFVDSIYYISIEIREKMYELLNSSYIAPFLDKSAICGIDKLRDEFSYIPRNKSNSLYVFDFSEHLYWYTFTSSKINYTLCFILNKTGYLAKLLEQKSCIIIENLRLNKENEFFEKLLLALDNIEQLINDESYIDDTLGFISKYYTLLPIEYQVKLLISKHFDVIGTRNFINQCKDDLISNNTN